MMYPRLKLARNLLTNDGTIFVSISDHEVDNLRKVLSEVFGESNYIGQVAVAKGTTTGQDANDIGSSIDFLLVFARSKKHYVPNGLPLDESDMARFNLEDSRGRYSILQYRKTGANDRRQDRPSMYFPLIAPDGSEVYPIGPGGYESRWRTGKQQFDTWAADDMIVWKRDADNNYKAYVKYYLEGRTKQVSNYWDDIEGNKKASITVKELLGKEIFTNPKPVGLIKKILHIATDQDSLVLDFFSGSATTGHAVMQLNADDGGSRAHIQVQLPEPVDEKSEAYTAGYRNIAEISRKRLHVAGDKIKAGPEQLGTREEALDIGYRSFRLVDTNFSKWRSASDVKPDKLVQHLLDLRDSAQDDATGDSLLVEVLIKQGYSLSEMTLKQEIAGLAVHAVGGGLLLAYLDEHTKPTLQQLRAVLDSPDLARLIVLEDAFKGDDELKTNLVQEAKTRGVELWTA